MGTIRSLAARVRGFGAGKYRFRFGSAISEARMNAENHAAVWGFLVAEGLPLFGW